MQVCKRATSVAYEAMECLGGNGYVEEGPMARLYRQAPLNSIWEGSGNVIALDILRALRTEPGAASALLSELHACRGADGRLDALTDHLGATLTAAADVTPRELEAGARLLVDRMALGLQAATLLRHGNPAAAAAYCASRLPARDAGWSFGATRADVADFGGSAGEATLIDRLMPVA